MTALLALLKSRGMIYSLLIGVPLLAASHAWAYRSGVTRQEDRQATADLVAVRQAMATRDAIERDLSIIAERAERRRAARRATHSAINLEFDRHVANIADSACWDPDSLRLVRAAARGERPDTGEPAATVPAPP